MPCRLSKAGLQDLSSHAIFVVARYAAPGLLGMSATIFLSAPILMKSGLGMLNYLIALQVPCALLYGTRTNRLSVII